MDIRGKLIAAGVRNLREFGYPSCNGKNILTDMIFSRFFLDMLRENKGQAGAEVDSIIDSMVKEIGYRVAVKKAKGVKKGKKG